MQFMQRLQRARDVLQHVVRDHKIHAMIWDRFKFFVDFDAIALCFDLGNGINLHTYTLLAVKMQEKRTVRTS
jgi:hypothetical protein